LNIRKILVAVNGSDPSLNARTYAIDLGKRFNVELIALLVIYPMYSQYETALSPRPARLEEVTRKEIILIDIITVQI
jgi:nucleotide-binding universal stress UspA family protein